MRNKTRVYIISPHDVPKGVLLTCVFTWTAVARLPLTGEYGLSAGELLHAGKTILVCHPYQCWFIEDQKLLLSVLAMPACRYMIIVNKAQKTGQNCISESLWQGWNTSRTFLCSNIKKKMNNQMNHLHTVYKQK